MQKRIALGFAAALAGSAIIISAGAQAKTFPGCTALGASMQAALTNKVLPGTIVQGIVNPSTLVTTTPFAQIIPAAPETTSKTPIGPTPAYCQISFEYLPGGSGPDNPGPGLENIGVPKGEPAYNIGQVQTIEINIFLPLNSTDGGSGGVQGNFRNGMMTMGSSGMSSGLSPSGFGDGLNVNSVGYAIRQGFIGTISDGGENYAGFFNQGTVGSSNFGIINTGTWANHMAYGTIADWIYRGTFYGHQWGNVLAEAYYGIDPKYHYYDGSSGGGNMGMGQVHNHGHKYDGYLIGAPAFRWQQFRLADSWPPLVLRKLVQLDGVGAIPTTAQQTALYNSMIAACDVEGTDVVADGLVADPRVCTVNFSATANVCGAPSAPASPNCLTADQAAAFDRIWDGPRNSHGARIWYPYDITINMPGSGFTGFTYNSVAVLGSTVQVVQWNHAVSTWPANNCLFVDAQSAALGTQNLTTLGVSACAAPGRTLTYEQEAVVGSKIGPDNGNGIPVNLYTDNEQLDLSLVQQHGAKIIQLRGTADPLIRWRHDADYYARVTNQMYGGTSLADYEQTMQWYRFFPQPMVGHSDMGGNGPYAFDPFVALRNWVEKGIKPKFLVAMTDSTGIDPGRTRPSCAFPFTAIYNGSGSTDDFNSFTCGGDLQHGVIKNANGVAIQGISSACNDVKTVFGQEDSANLDYKSVGLTASQCAPYLPPPHAGTTAQP